MNHTSTHTIQTSQPTAGIVPARLVFVATLPDGNEAFAFVTREGQPLLAITPAGTFNALTAERNAA